MHDVDEDILKLSESLGLSESELRFNLGLESPAPENGEESDLNSLREMFPHVPGSDVRAALSENGGNSERAAEQLLSWEALRPEIQTVDEIGGRKLRKAAKMARREAQRTQRSNDVEPQEVQALAEILGVAEPEARQLYIENGSSVTDAVLAKCTMTSTAVPVTQQQAVAAMESRNEYSGMSTRELEKRLSHVDAQLANVKERARSYGANPHTRMLSTDAYRLLRTLVGDRRDIERALNREMFFRNAVHSRHRIDLHGLTLETAQSVCRDVVLDFKTGSSTVLEIVTGAGRHSATGRSVIKEWLRGYLKAQKVRAEELEGSFLLRKKAIV